LAACVSDISTKDNSTGERGFGVRPDISLAAIARASKRAEAQKPQSAVAKKAAAKKTAGKRSPKKAQKTAEAALTAAAQ